MAYLLIVDDDEQMSSPVAAVLRKAGYEVACQCDPEAVIAQMEQRPPDALILDVMFPEDDFGGFELARTIRARPSLRAVPILLLTGVNAHHGLTFDNRDVDTSFLPVTEFLDKPVDLNKLVEKVNGLLAPVGA